MYLLKHFTHRHVTLPNPNKTTSFHKADQKITFAKKLRLFTQLFSQCVTKPIHYTHYPDSNANHNY